MKKQKNQIIVVGVILILLVISYVFVKKMNFDDTTEEETESYTITNLSDDDVVKMQYTNNQKQLEFVKEDDTWHTTEDESLTLDQDAISTMISYACNITCKTQIVKPEDLSQYGLMEPANTIVLTLSNQDTVTIYIGDYITMTGEYYLMKEGDENVYAVDSYYASSFEKSLDDLLVQETDTSTQDETQTTQQTESETEQATE